jgi:uncharacterized protein YggE
MNYNKRVLAVVAGIAVIIGLLSVACASAPAAAQQEPADPESATISVNGSGQVSAQPDVAILQLGVETQAQEASAALAQNNDQMQAVIDALTEADVSADNIQTQQVRLNPRFAEQRPTEPGEPVGQEVVGYTAANIVEVRVEALTAVGDLLDTAVTAGANRVQGIRFEISDPGDVVRQVREAAWQDAVDKAEQLADLAGVTLGNVVTINETSRPPVPVLREGVGGAAAAVPIEPGSQNIQVEIAVTWMLETGS